MKSLSRLRMSWIAALSLAFVGIASGQQQPQAPVTGTEEPNLSPQPPTPVLAAPSVPASTGTQVLSSADGDYILCPGDTIELSIFREPDLTSRSSIARDGTVQFPLIREVKIAGMNVRDARALLTGLFGDKYLVNPQVYLNVVEFAQRTFTVMGQVGKPGSYDLKGGQTLDLLEAIGMAGGFTRIADRGRVIIRRKLGSGEVQIIKANAGRMAQGKAETLLVQPGDVITISESWF